MTTANGNNRFKKGQNVYALPVVNYDEEARWTKAKVTRKFGESWDLVFSDGTRARIDDESVLSVAAYREMRRNGNIGSARSDVLDVDDAPRVCLCGCGHEITSRRKKVRFLQGHDGALRGVLLRAANGSEEDIDYRDNVADLEALTEYVRARGAKSKRYWKEGLAGAGISI